MLSIVEIFGPTIQGEGRFIGTPSVFVRFGGCNMSCSGFDVKYTTLDNKIKYSCDSFYASDSSFKSQWKQYNANQLINQLNKIIPDYKIDIVLTGGEPLLYWKDLEFQKVLEYYINIGHKITIETNGSIQIDLDKDYHKDIVFSIGLKLSNSNEAVDKRININNLINIINNTTESYLKFVIDIRYKDILINEIDQIIKNLPKCDIYLMPLGSTIDVVEQQASEVIKLAIEKGFYYSDRLHIRVWDNKRGV